MEILKSVLLLGFLTIVMILLFLYNILTLNRVINEEKRKKKLRSILFFSLLSLIFATSAMVISFSSRNIPSSYESTIKSDTNLK